MANKSYSLAHTKWMCKYHIVFTPKYRRKAIYAQYRKDLQEYIKTLCKYKGVEIIEGQSCSSLSNNTTENKCIKFHGLSQRKECVDDV